MDNGKRLCIYFFYDKDGIADRYVDAYLEGLQEVCDEFLIVSNGDITEDSRGTFRKYTEDILIRENKGFDVWAYKEALAHIGWDRLRQYHEVVLANCTLMGPVYPFSEMFTAMERKQELDFWGITAFGKLDQDPFGYSPYGYLPEHIQSHFIVYRNSFLQAEALKKYWDEIPEINSYEESIGRHESVFTKKFEDEGFRWDVYVHAPEENPTSYYLMMDPVSALKKDRCPVFKRRSFFQPQMNYIVESGGEQPWELFRFLKTSTSYDTDMILENLIRTCHQDDIVRTLRLTSILPSDGDLSEKAHTSRVAIVMHLFYMDLLEESAHYASMLPDDADIFVTTCKEENRPAIEKVFSALAQKTEIRVIENRGRDVSSLLVGAADLQDRYDLICFYHDKKTKQVSPYTIGQSFAYKVSECVLSSRAYVRNLIDAFERNPKLGLLTCPPPNHAAFLNTLAEEWGPNFDNTAALARELGIRVPMSPEHTPVAPLGTVFWYRTAAMKPLFRKQWAYEDFPPEPNDIDGTLLHAVERLYPFAVQEAGYYPAYCMPDHIASLEISNLNFYVREYNKVRLKYKMYGSFPAILDMENQRLGDTFNLVALANSANLTTQIRLTLKRHIPRKLYKAIVVAKRAVFGPHGIPFDEAELGDPK